MWCMSYAVATTHTSINDRQLNNPSHWLRRTVCRSRRREGSPYAARSLSWSAAVAVRVCCAAVCVLVCLNVVNSVVLYFVDADIV